MATLAELQADLEGLKSARRSGVRTSTFGARSVSYHTDKELGAAIAALEAEIAALEGTSQPQNIVVRPLRGW